jgi:hypothetical protein
MRFVGRGGGGGTIKLLNLSIQNSQISIVGWEIQPPVISEQLHVVY